jgi:hypothetical protein
MKAAARSSIGTVAATSLALGAAAAALAVVGKQRARRETSRLRARLCRARRPLDGTEFHPQHLQGLPAPVQRYLSLVLKEGQRPIVGVHLAQRGQMRLRPGSERWLPFDASQVCTSSPPGFDWAARVQIVPGVPALVHDTYVEGRGRLHAAVWGLLTVARAEGTTEMAQGELLRYLAEAVWFPTALLPSPRVRWEAIDGSRARVVLRDGPTEAALKVRFGADGLVESVCAPLRPRDTSGGLPPAPWLGRFRDYAWREGVQIPLAGEVEWHLPEGSFVYWRGRVLDIRYEVAG